MNPDPAAADAVDLARKVDKLRDRVRLAHVFGASHVILQLEADLESARAHLRAFLKAKKGRV